MHGIADQRLHLLQVLDCRLNIGVAEDHATYLRRAYVAGEVDADSLLFETSEILAEGAPVRGDFVMLVSGSIGLNDGVVQRGDGTAFAGHFGRDPLKDFRRQTRVDKDCHLGLAEHVDESGGDNFALRINGAFASGRGAVADSGDPSRANSDVS